MFSFSFASKMLNTIMGSDEQQPGQPGGPTTSMGGPPSGLGPGQPGVRPMGPGFPPIRPGGSPRSGFPGPPTFSGPRPTPGVRLGPGPPSFGAGPGPQRPTIAGGGTPHRFNGPQPPLSQQQQQQQLQQQPMQQQPLQQQQLQQQQLQQQPLPQHPAQMTRSPLPGSRMPMGAGPQRPRGQGPLGPGQQQHQQFPQRPPGGVAAPAAPVPDMDLSHLSAEERAIIENVMAKAQQLEQGPPAPAPGLPQPGPQMQLQQPQRMTRPEAQQHGTDLGGPVRMCPLCRQRDVTGKTDGMPGQECAECRLVVCSRCGGMSPSPETKRPEWACGNCINIRRQRMSQLSQQQQTQQQQQQHQLPGRPYGGQQGMEAEGSRRGSGGGMAQASPDRELDKIENRERVGPWGGTDPGKHRRRPSFEEIFSPEKTQYSEEPLHSESPIDVDFSLPLLPPDLSQQPQDPIGPCMSTPLTASASQAKPSYVITNNKLHSRSVSIDVVAEKQGNIISPPPIGFDFHAMGQMQETYIDEEQPCSSSQVFPQPPPPPPLLMPPEGPPPLDEKTSALMEELTRLQSAVDTTLKRRQLQKDTGDDVDPGRGRFKSIIRSRSPSPSPSPIGSPIYSPTKFSPEKELGSPESPDIPGPRKAIVLREHDLDDYKSSSEEESEGSEGSDEGRKGTGTDLYYDHSPGEVYTIPEEEDEGGSPTGSDLVTSLKHQGIGFQPTIPGDLGGPRRRGQVGQDMLQTGGDLRPLRPQLRPQRSLDNRLPSTHPQTDLAALSSMEQQQLTSYAATSNSINTQSVMHPGLGPLQTQQGTLPQDLVPSSMGLQTSGQPSAMASTLSTTSAIHGQVPPPTDQYGQPIQQHHLQQQPMQQTAFAQQQQHQGFPTQQPSPMHQQPESQMQQDLSQLQTSQQGPQMGQSGQGLQGMGMGGGSDWTTGALPPTSTSLPSTDHSAYQQQQIPSNTFSAISSSAVTPQTTTQQQPQYLSQQQGFPAQQGSQQVQGSYGAQAPMAGAQPPQQTQQFPGQQTLPTLQSQQQQSPLHGGTGLQQPIPLQPGQPATAQQPTLQDAQLHQLAQQQAQAQQLAHQQSWLEQQQQQQLQQQQLQYDQARLPTSGAQSFVQGQSPLTQAQASGIAQPGDTQYQQSLLLQQQTTPDVATSQAGPGAKSISGLLADFSRALGLGATSPTASPSQDKNLAFPIPSSLSTMPNQMQLSPYDSYQTQQGVSQSIPHQQSAFVSIPDSYQRPGQQVSSYLSQSPQPGLPSHMTPQFGSGIQTSQAQQFQVVTQGLQQQQQAGQVGVGVIGALSPAQAHMYQQQMAMQHQQQHMKKRSRGGQLTTSSGGDLRRDGSNQSSTVLIGGQGLAMTPSGMTISALTPAVVTSLGTFIGGGPTILGTQLLQQPLAVTPLGTPIGTPVGTPRSGRELPGGDSSDTMSETDSQKSLRMRRKLPCLPPDQEAAPLPSTKKRERDRHRSQEHLRSLSPMRIPSSDGMLSSRQYPFTSLSLSRPSASESNLRKISMNASEQVPRPGSALGLLQASSVVSSMGGKPDVTYPMSLGTGLFSTSSTFPGMRGAVGYPGDMTTTTSVLAGLYPSHKTAQENWNANLAELAACLPPDLRHLLNKGSGTLEQELSSLSGLGDMNAGSQLPSYIRSLREQLQEERRQLLSEERRRLEALRERDRELGARLDAVTSRAGSEGLRSRAELGISRSAGASPLLSRKMKTHRRQLSDPKLSLPFSPIQEDGDPELQDFDRVSAGLLRAPYKSYEYESLQDGALLHQRQLSSSPAIKPQLDWDHSQSYLTSSSWAAAGGALRETAISSMGLPPELEALRVSSSGTSSRYLTRRNSEGETPVGFTTTSSRLSSRRHGRKHRKSRSWHPSPYVSEEEEEEEEDLMSREEKKARIKAEIARRRQQMQDRGGLLHSSDLSRLRDPTDQENSVLKSVDQLLREQQFGRFDARSLSYGRLQSQGYTHQGLASGMGRFVPLSHHGPVVVSPVASEEDRSIERIASTFRSGDELYYHERLGEMSPMATDSESMGSELGAPAAMPILPDMPTRSRRLLEDLGSMPIGLGGLEGGRGTASSQNTKGKYGVPSSGLGLPYRTML